MVPFPTLQPIDMEEYSTRDSNRRVLEKEILGLLTIHTMQLEQLMRELTQRHNSDQVREALLNLLDTGYLKLDSDFTVRDAR